MGLIHATSGRTSILGHAVNETAFRKQIGFLPENPYFYDYLTGREILHFYAKLSGVERSKRAHRVDELLGYEISIWVAGSGNRGGAIVVLEEPEGMNIPLKAPKKPKEKNEEDG